MTTTPALQDEQTCPDCGHDLIYACECPATAICHRHGEQAVTDESATPGFTGATIYFATLACGCVLCDASGDTLESVR